MKLIDADGLVDVEPMRYGYWVPVTDNRGGHFVCPYCGEWKYHQGQKYCGECGAKLEEGYEVN